MKYEGKPLSLAIGQQHTVELPPQISRLRLTGFLFENDKTFLLPIAMKGIRELVDVYDDHPGAAVVVTGHTDRVGDDAYNVGLSEERAAAIAQFLTDDVEGWAKRYAKQPFSSVWGTREDQLMLSAVLDESGQPFLDGPPTGQADAKTRDAIQRFQRSRGLADDGVAGPDTRRALITAYMSLDGTTLPKSARLETLGCGEHHNQVPTDDEQAEPDNRRAEIFFFDPGPPDPAVPSRCPGEGCPYQTWKQHLDRDDDVDHDLCELVVQVVERGNERVPDASVRLSGPASREQLTDGDGVAWFRNLTRGRYDIAVEKTGFTSEERSVEVPESEEGGDRHAFGEDSQEAGSFEPVRFVLSPDSFRVQVLDPTWVTEQAREKGPQSVHIFLANLGPETILIDGNGRGSTPTENAPAATVSSVERSTPHRRPIKPRILDTPPDLQLQPGVEQLIEVSARLRLSIWPFIVPFVNESSTQALDRFKPFDASLGPLIKSSGVDDISFVTTITWDKRDNDTDPPKPPKWHPAFNLGGNHVTDEMARALYLIQLHDAVSPTVRVQAGFEMVKRSKLHPTDTEPQPELAAAANDFASWLLGASPEQIGEYADSMRMFFDVRDIPIDGIGFDFELDALTKAHEAKMGILIAKTSEAFAERNGFVSYANGPYTAEDRPAHDKGIVPGMLQPFSFAAAAPNLLARAMTASDTDHVSKEKIAKSIAFALSGDPDARIQPSQLQFGIDTAVSGIDDLCRTVFRPNRVGLVMTGFPVTKGQVTAALDKCKALDAILNEDEAPPGTSGQPLQVPND